MYFYQRKREEIIKMKKTFAFLMALVMVLSLAAISPAARATDEMELGSVSDNVYWNETIKVGCKLDSNWYFYTQEEILKVNGTTADMLEGDLAEMMKEGGSLTDMFAENQETAANVNVVIQQLSLTESLMIDEKNYLEVSIPMLEEGLIQIGLEDVKIVQNEREFLGGEHQSLEITGSIGDFSVYETMVAMKSGRTIVLVTVFTADKTELEDILGSFFNKL